jgi:2-oxoglutarate ferredoxin oxidoreductase subunit delta
MGTITVDARVCKGCELCVAFCPFDILVMGEEINEMGYHIPKLTDESRCTACRICAWMCPDAAIEVYRTPRSRGKSPTQVATSQE